jgi:tRNA 2-thiocytidine biosynthesis protein TtcA
MLRDWERESPGRVAGIFRALQNVALSQLADRSRFEFEGLTIDRSGSPKEYAFDEARVAAAAEEQTIRFVDAI